MNIAFLSAIIGLLSLDTTIAFQTLVSSPLFSCPLIGLILGDVRSGFELGILLQLLWLSRIHAGAVVFPEGNIASMIVAVLVILNKDNGFPNTNLTIIFFEGILVSFMGARVTLFYRKINGKILEFVNEEVESAHFRMIILLEASSMLVYFLMMFLFTYFLLFLSELFLPKILMSIGSLFEKQFILIKPVILGLGLALTFPLFRETFRTNKRN